ncbi:MAG: transposase [Desulfobacteraceae bacterium]|jgi:putative transposase|nr:transposase [Desulfobacteraceae bacterium]
MPRKILDKENHAHFVTFSCYRRQRILDDEQAKRIVIHFLTAQLKNQNGICMGFVIMPDHVHAIVQFQELGKLSVFMNQWKRRSSIQLKHLYKEKLINYGAKIDLEGPMWQPKYYDFNIFSESKAREKLIYMHLNPVKSGLIDRPENWKFSSARFYLLSKPTGVPITKIL